MIDFPKALKQFKDKDYEENKSLYYELDSTQSPHTLFIGCSDSRLSPERLLQAEPGELFHIRNIANVVPPAGQSVKFASTTTAIEYAVEVLGVENVIICGHSNCGGCDACLNPPENLNELPYTEKWISQLYPTRDRVLNEVPASEPEARSLLLEELNVVTQMKNLETFPNIKKRIESGKLKVHGWHYRIGSGEVAVYNKENRSFEVINK